VRAELAAAASSSPAAYTDIRFERRRGVAILRRGRELEALTEQVTGGGVVRCLAAGGGWGSSSFESLDQLPAAIRLAHEYALQASRRDPPPFPALPGRELEIQCLAQADPVAVSLARKLDLTDLVASSLLDADRRIADVLVQYTDELVETVVATSEGSALSEHRPEFTLSVMAAADEAGTTERVVDSIAARSWSDLESGAATAPAIAERAVSLLHAVPLRGGRYPVVLAPRAAGLLVHRAVGHLCEADGDTDVRSPIPTGTRIGPDALTIGDDPTADGLRGTRAFDHEGLKPRKTILVQHGVVVGLVHTRSTAAVAGVAPTGSARGSGLGLPRARLSNTYVAAGPADPIDLFDGVSAGLLIEELAGVSLEQGGVALRAGFARMIRHGEATEPVKGVTLGGDALVLLGQLDLVGSDFEWDHSAAWCVRPGAGRVPVSTGAPHLRLLEVPVGDAA
jgi:TldD protein